LLYKNQKENIKKEGISVVWKKLIFMYSVSLIIELFSLYLFGVNYGSTEMLVKVLVIGSFSAMASSVSFSLI
jgi:hypothetical protein